MSEKNRQFDSFEQWAQQGLSWLSGHGLGRRATCYDAKGRPCRTEDDFQRARADDAFPVQWVTPDQKAGALRPPPSAPPGWHDPGPAHNGALVSVHPSAPNRTSRFAQEEENRRSQNNLLTKAAALGAIHTLTGQKAEARPRHASESGPDSEERDAELAEILIHALEALHAGGAPSVASGHAAAATPIPAPEGHSLMAQAHAHTAKFAAQEEEKKSDHKTSADAGPSGAGVKESAREEDPEEEDEEKEERHESHHGDAKRERQEREAREAREARERQEREEREAQKRQEQEERAREAARRAEISHFEAIANPTELTVDIMAVGADGAPVLLAHCDTMAAGVLAAHEISALTDQICRFVDPDLGEILPGDPVPENITTWIETRLSPAPAYATPFDMTAPSPYA